MNLEKLEKILENEPKYRLKQANEAVFVNFISNWNEATFFTKDLRDKLNKECPLEIKVETLISKKEESVKAKITLTDGLEIESVLMRHKDGRNTVCVSCQVGCPMNCAFCATGKMGFKRDLNYFEILEQVIFFDRLLKKENQHVTNVTFMGMGEPFLNYENIMSAIRILNDKDVFNIGARSISVSTAGIIDGIKKFSEEGLQLNLAISLHAPNDKLRSELMPVNKMANISKLLSVVDDYILKTKRKVMFEYVLIKDVNDTDECAKQLAELMKNPSTLLRARKLYFVNLILYNKIGGHRESPNSFEASTIKRVEAFKKILTKEKINFVQRYRFGDDIAAACGQFATLSTGEGS